MAKKKKVKPTKEGGLKQFLASPQFAIVRGSFYVLFAAFAAIAILSYVLWYIKLGLEPSRTVNWCGTFGGWLASVLVSGSFGLASLGLCFLLFVYGLRLIVTHHKSKSEKAPRRTLWRDDRLFRKTLWSVIFWVMWLCTTIGWLANPENGDQYTLGAALSGVVGTELARLLYGLLHIGLPILQLFLACMFLFLVHNVRFHLPERKERPQEDATPQEVVEETDDEEEEEKKQGFIQRLFGRHKEDVDSDDEDDENEGVEFESDSHLDDIVIERVQKRRANQEEEEEPVQQEKPEVVTFSIDDEFEKVNSRAGRPGEKAGQSNEPIFTVNDMQDEGSKELSQEEEDLDPDDYRVHYGIDEPYDPKLDLKDFKMPDTDILEDWEKKNVKVTNEELVSNKNRIVETLRNYGIEIVEITASPGPTVTLYEIKPAPGIRISKIKSLEDDIALSLSALGIRIIAPIPGKGTIGIEVPNANPQVVSMKTMLTSDAFRNSKAELPIAFGKTISNDVFVTDLAKMPHLLMAGATGTGKSVGLNAVIASLLYKKHPAELKFVMVDPKKVELSLYNAIERHYLAKLPDSEEAIITDVKKVVRTLNSLCIEMDQRYDLLKSAKVRNLQEYNPKFVSRQLNPDHGHRYLPYIVLVIDEFADLIMTAGKEVELPICRLAQLARAVGIHLIIATQRPTTNIITGAIKANFPARIAFRVISAIDSRTILDTSGANQLIGRGDMLISLAGKDLVRCQCALIETIEIERLAQFIGQQRGYAEGEGFLLPEYLDENDEPNKEFDAKSKDEFFNDAARLVVASQFGSTSLLQRKLSLGYNRAGRIIDQLEAAGIVGPYNGSKARDVLIKDEVALEELLKSL
ncbi:MAG: DNA translocase FtsK 4TM domain-containing protein [Bacteroidales bacterium]|nr:DNA translocase FtsK 4TM domain-containing protein [Bacteroidales bacterium]